jgi:hypothetical protein
LREANRDQGEQLAHAAGLLLTQRNQGEVGQVGHRQASLRGTGTHRLQQGLVIGGELSDLLIDEGQGILTLESPLSRRQSDGVGIVSAHPNGDQGGIGGKARHLILQQIGRDPLPQGLHGGAEHRSRTAQVDQLHRGRAARPGQAGHIARSIGAVQGL